jgi:hypothetical protein
MPEPAKPANELELTGFRPNEMIRPNEMTRVVR